MSNAQKAHRVEIMLGFCHPACLLSLAVVYRRMDGSRPLTCMDGLFRMPHPPTPGAPGRSAISVLAGGLSYDSAAICTRDCALHLRDLGLPDYRTTGREYRSNGLRVLFSSFSCQSARCVWWTADSLRRTHDTHRSQPLARRGPASTRGPSTGPCACWIRLRAP